MTRTRTTVASFLALGVTAAAAPVHAAPGLFRPSVGDVSAITAPPSTAVGGVMVAPPISGNNPVIVAPPSTSNGGVVVTPPVPTNNGALVNISLTYSPSALNLGVVRAYKNQQGSAVLTVTSPTDGTVSARLQPSGPFQVARMTSYELGVWAPGTPGTSTSSGGIVTSQRRIVSTVAGDSLSVKAGQSVEVEVALPVSAETSAYPRANLTVAGHQWVIDVPVGATVEHEPEIGIELLVNEVKIAVDDEREIPIRLKRTPASHNVWRAPVARNVTITAQSLPAGVTMEPVTVHVPADAQTVDAKLRIKSNQFTPVASWETAAFLVDTGADREVVKRDAHVYPASMSWPYNRKVGDLSHEGILTIHKDGNWWWRATVKNKARVMGAWWSVYITFNNTTFDPVSGTDSTHWMLEYGQLSGSLLGDGYKAEIDQSSDNDRYLGQGPNKWVRENYFDAVDKGISIKTYHSSDPTTIAKLSIMAIPYLISMMKDAAK